MNIKDVYGYEPYSVDDPEMEVFLKAIDYLDVPQSSRGGLFGAVKRFLINNNIIDGEWKHMSYTKLGKLPYSGKCITVVVIAQMFENGIL